MTRIVAGVAVGAVALAIGAWAWRVRRFIREHTS